MARRVTKDRAAKPGELPREALDAIANEFEFTLDEPQQWVNTTKQRFGVYEDEPRLADRRFIADITAEGEFFTEADLRQQLQRLEDEILAEWRQSHPRSPRTDHDASPDHDIEPSDFEDHPSGESLGDD